MTLPDATVGTNPSVVPHRQLKMMVYASMTAALTAAGAWIAIPVGPVPIVLQNLFIYLAGLLLGLRWGLASVGIYLLAGAFGLPVFAGGMGGVGRIVGPTGGYLVGFLPAVAVIGLVSERFRGKPVFDILAMILGTAVIYGLGTAWLHMLTKMTWAKTLALGMLPFLPGDVLKIVAAAGLARALRPILEGQDTEHRT